ncbi:NYN domain-containing protein [Thermomonas sp. XSG]|uniref:NYN domain-containing protein n=1 Tax=Thermomonas sp. XSG TaxID=2771436 RepID=UPI0016803E99|nr:NYN domain-containing protein [Thermomonas sp. XSG]QNU15423.1 NYN domain-containing protein [Thermomonas sp. XSG]
MKTRTHVAHDDGQRRLAVLIDADNAQASVIEGLLAEVAKYGLASVKRIYGDFTTQQQAQWKKVLLKHSISPVQQFAYTSGKNATDSALIIDAMDLMYTGRFDGMCLVSSDSDFTRLAQRLREEGLTVYGFGEHKTPDPFVQACDKFTYTEVLRAEAPEPAGPAAPVKPARKQPAKKQAAVKTSAPAQETAVPPAPPSPPAKAAPLPLPLGLLRQAIEEASDEEGWAHLGAMGAYLNKIKPNFDPRLYGQKKLSDLLRKQPKHFSVVERETPAGVKALFVKALAG